MTDTMTDTFGPVIYAYTDAQAVDDGVLIALSAPNGRRTPHRLTPAAANALAAKHGMADGQGEPDYARLVRFVLAELLPLVGFVRKADAAGDVWTTNLMFQKQKFQSGRSDQLWLMPNEVGGITVMLPDDY